MAKELSKWLDEFIENGADATDVGNWPENAGGGANYARYNVTGTFMIDPIELAAYTQNLQEEYFSVLYIINSVGSGEIDSSFIAIYYWRSNGSGISHWIIDGPGAGQSIEFGRPNQSLSDALIEFADDFKNYKFFIDNALLVLGYDDMGTFMDLNKILIESDQGLA